jgi:hypothetical protein
MVICHLVSPNSSKVVQVFCQILKLYRGMIHFEHATLSDFCCIDFHQNLGSDFFRGFGNSPEKISM